MASLKANTGLFQLKSTHSNIKDWRKYLLQGECGYSMNQLSASTRNLYTLAAFKYFIMKNGAFGNVFHNSQKSICTNQKIIGFLCRCKCYCWLRSLIDSLYNSSRKIPELERCANSLVNYRIITKSFCDFTRQIMQEIK